METRIGRYEIVREVARGGLGVVYEAIDTELRRRVALKILQDERLCARLQREAQAAARLTHSNIVKVYEVGDAFIAMEFVDGRTLEALAPELAPRRRLEIIETVARAVAHAHAHGVVHRDLKPANVMIETAGRVVLVDFGLARAQDGEDLTRTGAVLGTPYYMSPEQVLGRTAGPPADVWALGVMLHELVSGRLPFEGSSPPVIYQAIVDRDPPRLDSDPRLAAICLKALDKDPRGRYAGALEFANDLRRHLDGRGVLARPRRPGRRRLIVAATAAVTLFALAGLARVRLASPQGAPPAALYLPLERELDLLRANLRRPDFALTDDDFRRTEELVGTLERQMTPSAPGAQAWYLIGRCREVLMSRGGAEAAYERALAIDPDHAPTLLARGRLEIESAVWHESRDRAAHRTQAVARTARALDLMRRAARASEAEVVQDLAQAYLAVFGDREDAYAFTQSLFRKWKDGPFAEEFLTAWAKGYGGERRRRAADEALATMPSSYVAYFWRGTARERDDAPGALADYTQALRINPRFAFAHKMRGRLRGARGDLEGALADFVEATRLDPADAGAWVSLAKVRTDMGDHDAAVADADRGIELDPGAALGYYNRAVARGALGDVEGAIADYTRAIEIAPDAPAYCNRAHERLRKGDPPGAIEDATRAVELEPAFALAHVNRGRARQAAGDAAGAIAECTRALEIDPRCANAWYNRGNARQDMGDFDGAIADHTRAIELNPRDADAPYNRGNAHRALGELQTAVADYTRAIELDPRHANAHNNRGLARQELRDLDGAFDDFTKAIEVDPRFAMPWHNRGTLRAQRDEVDAAIADLTRAIELDSRFGLPHLIRAYAYRAKGNAAGAIADFEMTLELMPADWPARPNVQADLEALRR